MPLQVRRKEDVRYTLVRQRGEADPAVFLIRELGPERRADIKDEKLYEYDSDGKITLHQMSCRLFMLCEQLTGWEGVVDGTYPVKFPTDPMDALALLEEEDVEELLAVFGDGFFDRKTEAKIIEESNKQAKSAKK